MTRGRITGDSLGPDSGANADAHAGSHNGTGPRRNGFKFIFLALAVLCLYALYRSPLLRLSDVEVTGAQRLTEDQVMQIARLAPGVSRLERPAGSIAADLMREPWVRSARAAWHGNRVRIDLQERAAVGLIHYYDWFYLALDESGVVLEQTTLDAAGGLPVVSGLFVTKGLRGATLTHQGLLDALTVLARMAPALRSQVSEVAVDPDRTLTLYMATGPTVLWGPVPDGKDREVLTEQKIQEFGWFWQTLPAKRLPACRIDLRVDGKAISSGCG